MRSPLLFLALALLCACPAPARKPVAPPPTKGTDPCAMVEIPAGFFLRGSAGEVGEKDERPQRRIWVSSFKIDKHEVTVDQYKRCVNAGACSDHHLLGDEGRGKGFSPNAHCNWGKLERETHPLNCVSWAQADRYCRWVSKRLPCEAEWEKAARGTDGRTYPWGNSYPTCERAVMIKGGVGCGEDRTWPIGSKSPEGDSPYGAQDMAGNVYEWVSDWYRADYYRTGPWKDPPGPTSGRFRIARGGSWYNYGNYLRAAYRSRIPPDPKLRLIHLGFRCVRSIPGPAAPATLPSSRPSSLPADN